MKTGLLGCLLLAGAALSAAGCVRGETEDAGATAQATWSFRELPSPAGPGSGEPNLYTTPDGEVLLSWIASDGEGRHALRYSTLQDEQTEGDAWSAPRTIAEGDDWFVNWADFPSLTALEGGALAAHFLARSGAGRYAYDVRIVLSGDGGATWRPAVTPHRDGTPTEHGFVSMVPWTEGRLLAVWLDGRNTGGESHEGQAAHGPSGAMTLRTAVLDPSGTLYDEAELDARICDCCQTSAARTPHGVVVAYRDRSDDEVRDISVVRRYDGRWSAPRTLHADGWTIHGCPVNGPAVAAEGQRVAVAWFTAAQDKPRVQVAFSADEGASFGEPVIVDEGRPVGRVDLVLLADGAALVSWIEQTDGGAEIRARRILPDGTRDASFAVTPTTPERAGGFPRLTRSGPRIVMAWTEAGSPPTVRTAVATRD